MVAIPNAASPMSVSPITIPQSLAYVLNRAGEKNGVDFDYLLQTAMRESSLNPNAKAPTSSAVGLFQFLESTWLDVMKSDGARLGYKNYADSIETGSDGELFIRDPQVRAKVLKLREDPQVAADMAAAFTKRNGDYLRDQFGRVPSPGELYIAHFLGARGAEKLFRAGLQNADQIAADLFPKQAEANRAIFYDNGHARTIKQVYRALVARHDGAVPSGAQFAAQQIGNGMSPQEPHAPLEMSFTDMFRTGGAGGVTSPLAMPKAAPIATPSGSAGSGASFFVQLYSQ